jgi:hypothetical protein
MTNIITADGDVYTMFAEEKEDFDQVNNGEGGWNYVWYNYYDFFINYLIYVDITNLTV